MRGGHSTAKVAAASKTPQSQSGSVVLGIGRVAVSTDGIVSKMALNIKSSPKNSSEIINRVA